MTDSIKDAANRLSHAADADVLLINSGMDRGVETKIIDRFARRTAHRTNAVVLMVTSGGDADVAYRIARCLQRRYRKITAVISGYCKSAGTLLAIGAHELAFSDHGLNEPLYFLSDAPVQTATAKQAPTDETQQADPTGPAGQEPAAQGAADPAAPTAPVDEVDGAQVVQFPEQQLLPARHALEDA